jgi:hypothetical protein
MHVWFWWGNLGEGRHRQIWEDNIRMDLTEVGRIDVATDMNRWQTLVNTVMNLPVQ